MSKDLLSLLRLSNSCFLCATSGTTFLADSLASSLLYSTVLSSSTCPLSNCLALLETICESGEMRPAAGSTGTEGFKVELAKFSVILDSVVTNVLGLGFGFCLSGDEVAANVVTGPPYMNCALAVADADNGGDSDSASSSS